MSMYSGCFDRYRAIIDADREWFSNHPRRRHRTRACLIEEVQAMPPFKQVPEQPYSAILRRVGTGLAFQKIIVPEVIIAGLPEKPRVRGVAALARTRAREVQLRRL